MVDRYALVSSFYGPGAVGGWCLICLGCLISLGIHRRKRGIDTITADFIAALTFPTVAAGHLLSQTISFSKNREHVPIAQLAASMEAPLIIVEAFLAIVAILFLLATNNKCIRRGCLLAAVGLFCFFAECHVYFSPSVTQLVKPRLRRSFLITFGRLLISIMVVLIICTIFAICCIAVFFLSRPKGAQAQSTDTRSGPSQRDREFKESHSAFAITRLTSLFIPYTFVATMFPLLSLQNSGTLPSQFGPWVRATAVCIAGDMIPKSDTSIMDLDQGVALLAGATVLGFSIYSTVESYYQVWQMRTRSQSPEPGIELRRQASRNEAWPR